MSNLKLYEITNGFMDLNEKEELSEEERQDDYDVMKIVKVLEPEKYYKKLEGLKKEKQNNE